MTNVVPLSPSDPNGAGLAAAGFPLLIGGFIGGIGLAFVVQGAARRITALALYSAVAGLLVAGVLQGWFDILQGNYLANAGAYALTFAAIGAPILGAISLLGPPGVALGPVVFMLFANPISSANAPTQFLPGPWGEIGQWFPPGASAHLVRSLSYFPDASVTFPLLVLSGWTVAGLVATAIARPSRNPSTTTSTQPVEPADSTEPARP